MWGFMPPGRSKCSCVVRVRDPHITSRVVTEDISPVITVEVSDIEWASGMITPLHMFLPMDSRVTSIGSIVNPFVACVWIMTQNVHVTVPVEVSFQCVLVRLCAEIREGNIWLERNPGWLAFRSWNKCNNTNIYKTQYRICSNRCTRKINARSS